MITALITNYEITKNIKNYRNEMNIGDEITLQVATYLTKVPKETQVNILKTCGVKGVNKITMKKLLTKNISEMCEIKV